MTRLLIVNRTLADAEALAHVLRGEASHLETIPARVSDARRLIREHSPELALLELETAIGLRLVRDLLASLPALKVFAYGLADDEREQRAWAAAGVFCILARDTPLLNIVDVMCAQGVAAATSAPLRRDRAVSAALLTRRESDVLQLIALGLTNREVADTLCLELPTVKNHIQHVMRKLGVHRRGDAARYLGDVAFADEGARDVEEIAADMELGTSKPRVRSDASRNGSIVTVPRVGPSSDQVLRSSGGAC